MGFVVYFWDGGQFTGFHPSLFLCAFFTFGVQAFADPAFTISVNTDRSMTFSGAKPFDLAKIYAQLDTLEKARLAKGIPAELSPENAVEYKGAIDFTVAGEDELFLSGKCIPLITARRQYSNAYYNLYESLPTPEEVPAFYTKVTTKLFAVLSHAPPPLRYFTNLIQ